MAVSSGKEFEFIPPRQKNLIPRNNRIRYSVLIHIEEALRHSWGPDTCADWERYKWSPVNPAFGQCAVTALVVQDFAGGTIVKDPEFDHYWNRLNDGTEVDLSREQFNVTINPIAKEIREREYMLTHERSIKAKTPERYRILRERVEYFYNLQKG